MDITTKRLYVATKNPDRYNSLVKSFDLLNTKVSLLDILDPSIPECAEYGSNSSENSKIKAQYYSNLLKENSLSEDDSVFFDGLTSEEQPAHLVNSYGLNMSKPRFWLNFIKKKHLTSGKLVKNFCLVRRDGGEYTFSVTVPFVIKIPSLVTVRANSLNNFMIPKHFSSTFVDMTNTEKKLFSRRYLLEGLSGVVNKLV